MYVLEKSNVHTTAFWLWCFTGLVLLIWCADFNTTMSNSYSSSRYALLKKAITSTTEVASLVNVFRTKKPDFTLLKTPKKMNFLENIDVCEVHWGDQKGFNIEIDDDNYDDESMESKFRIRRKNLENQKKYLSLRPMAQQIISNLNDFHVVYKLEDQSLLEAFKKDLSSNSLVIGIPVYFNHHLLKVESRSGKQFNKHCWKDPLCDISKDQWKHSVKNVLKNICENLNAKNAEICLVSDNQIVISSIKRESKKSFSIDYKLDFEHQKKSMKEQLCRCLYQEKDAFCPVDAEKTLQSKYGDQLNDSYDDKKNKFQLRKQKKLVLSKV
eukprot:Awhi_evm1s1525